MTNASNDSDVSLDISGFEDWLEETAAREGGSPEDVLQQLISSYWILNELSEELEDTAYAGDLEDLTSGDSVEAGDDPDGDQLTEVVNAIAEMQTTTADTTRSSSEMIDPNLIELIKVLNTREDTPSQLSSQLHDIEHIWGKVRDLEGSVDRLDDDVEEVYRDLQRDIDTVAMGVSDEIENLQAEHTSLEDLTAERLESLDEKVDAAYGELRRVIGAYAESLDILETETADLGNDLDHVAEETQADIDHLEAFVDELDSELTATSQSVDRVDSQLESFENTVEARLEQLRSDLDSTSTDMEDYLQQLFNITSDHKQDLSDLVTALDDRVHKVVEEHEASYRLDHLLTNAHERGITDAVCETCEESVDLAMLRRPVCPGCNRELSGGIETKSFLWRKTHYLQTASPGQLTDVPRFAAAVADADSEDA